MKSTLGEERRKTALQSNPQPSTTYIIRPADLVRIYRG